MKVNLSVKIALAVTAICLMTLGCIPRATVKPDADSAKIQRTAVSPPSGAQEEYPPTIIDLSLDQQTYRSGVSGMATVSLEGGNGNAVLKVFGVKDRRGNYRVRGSKNVSLGGKLEENFTFTMPSCYGCVGVSPGDYTITTELRQAGKVIAQSEQVISLQK